MPEDRAFCPCGGDGLQATGQRFPNHVQSRAMNAPPPDSSSNDLEYGMNGSLSTGSVPQDQDDPTLRGFTLVDGQQGDRGTAMTHLNMNVGELRRLLARATMVLSILALPLITMTSVQAGGENMLGFQAKKSSGAGLVLLVSLQRAR